MTMHSVISWQSWQLNFIFIVGSIANMSAIQAGVTKVRVVGTPDIGNHDNAPTTGNYSPIVVDRVRKPNNTLVDLYEIYNLRDNSPRAQNYAPIIADRVRKPNSDESTSNSDKSGFISVTVATPMTSETSTLLSLETSTLVTFEISTHETLETSTPLALETTRPLTLETSRPLNMETTTPLTLETTITTERHVAIFSSIASTTTQQPSNLNRFKVHSNSPKTSTTDKPIKTITYHPPPVTSAYSPKPTIFRPTTTSIPMTKHPLQIIYAPTTTTHSLSTLTAKLTTNKMTTTTTLKSNEFKDDISDKQLNSDVDGQNIGTELNARTYSETIPVHTATTTESTNRNDEDFLGISRVKADRDKNIQDSNVEADNKNEKVFEVTIDLPKYLPGEPGYLADSERFSQ